MANVKFSGVDIKVTQGGSVPHACEPERNEISCSACWCSEVVG